MRKSFIGFDRRRVARAVRLASVLVIGVVLAACGGSSRSAGDDDSDAGTGGDGGNPPNGTSCGGFGGNRCGANQYCDFPDNACGSADGTGTCKARPQFCPAVVRPVCGCDGMVHPSDCLSAQEGADLNANARCTLPAGKFACGYAVCDVTTEYCKDDPHAAGGHIYTCTLLPAACGSNPACACLSGETCGRSCAGDGGTGLTLTCP